MEGLGTLSIVKNLMPLKTPFMKGVMNSKSPDTAKSAKNEGRLAIVECVIFTKLSGVPAVCPRKWWREYYRNLLVTHSNKKGVKEQGISRGSMIAGKWITAAHKQIIGKTTFDTCKGNSAKFIS